MREHAWGKVSEGLVGAVGVVAVVTPHLDLMLLTGERVDDGLEPWLFALGCGVVGAAVGATYGLVWRIAGGLKEYSLEGDSQRRRSHSGMLWR